MILECSITNFRSIQEKQTFTMLASSAKSKAINTFDVVLANGESIKLVKTAAIYGGNASGKSTIIRALFEIRKFIVDSKEITIDLPIPAYDPFLFNPQTKHGKSEFELLFLTRENHKFQYKIVYDKDEIIEETLFHFPKKKAQNIFIRGEERKEKDSNIHIAKLGKEFGYKKHEIYKKIPFLSIFGKAENYHTIISPVFSYFNELEIWNVTSSTWVNRLANEIKMEMQNPDNADLFKQLENLIYSADTQIQSLKLDVEKKTENKNDENKVIKRYTENEVIFGEHKVFENKKEISSYYLPFSNESFGTNKLFAIGGLIIKILNRGGVLFFDELDSSMHPILTNMLIEKFQESTSVNAQLIFTTHETNLLSKEFRSDQIWFTQKNEFGETELFSAQDFEGVREEMPFEKWYLAGKFGAIPTLNSKPNIKNG